MVINKGVKQRIKSPLTVACFYSYVEENYKVSRVRQCQNCPSNKI